MRNNMAAGGKFYTPSQIGHYLLSRISSLAPPKAGPMKSPIAILKQLDRHQWLMFSAGFIGWTWDSFDFFTVSLTVTELAKQFEVENSEVTWVRYWLLRCEWEDARLLMLAA